MRSRLMRVSDEFARELEDYRRNVERTTYPKITRQLVPAIKQMKCKKQKQIRKKRVDVMENMLGECLRI